MRRTVAHTVDKNQSDHCSISISLFDDIVSLPASNRNVNNNFPKMTKTLISARHLRENGKSYRAWLDK